MHFDWTTFFLEVLNFFILLWILRRFLYRPVLDVIQARRQKIDAQLQDATARQAEADAARRTCEAHLAEWDQEKARCRTALELELAAERERLMEIVNREVVDAKARHQAQDEHERREWRRMTEQQAIELGGQFVKKVLERVASPELEERLIAELLAELANLSAEALDTLKAALAEDGLVIISAFPLSLPQRAALTDALARLAGGPLYPDFKEDPALLAGLLIHTGSRMLAANLRDELRFFRDLDDAERID